MDSDNYPFAQQTLKMRLFACTPEAGGNFFHLVGVTSENFEDVAGAGGRRARTTDGSLKTFFFFF